MRAPSTTPHPLIATNRALTLPFAVLNLSLTTAQPLTRIHDAAKKTILPSINNQPQRNPQNASSYKSRLPLPFATRPPAKPFFLFLWHEQPPATKIGSSTHSFYQKDSHHQRNSPTRTQNNPIPVKPISALFRRLLLRFYHPFLSAGRLRDYWRNAKDNGRPPTPNLLDRKAHKKSTSPTAVHGRGERNWGMENFFLLAASFFGCGQASSGRGFGCAIHERLWEIIGLSCCFPFVDEGAFE